MWGVGSVGTDLVLKLDMRVGTFGFGMESGSGVLFVLDHVRVW